MSKKGKTLAGGSMWSFGKKERLSGKPVEGVMAKKSWEGQGRGGLKGKKSHLAKAEEVQAGREKREDS